MLSHALHAIFADSADQRASDRRVLRLEARVATETGESGLQVHNLSRTGLLLGGAAGVAAGSEIEVELPGGTSHRAQVVWADEALFGCRFTKALTRAQLGAALLRSAPREPAPDAAPRPLTPAEALARLREHWDEEPEPANVLASERKLPLGTRMWAIAGLGLTGWAVPAVAVWMFW
ncbi:MAG: PilZ domain-containing protein [Qipengyuania sp.]|jgi:hypothetical protein|nr:PilZ domain-containing protein [Qipengyuania sp.]